MPKRVGSGRKTSVVANLFNNVVSTSKIPKVECTFCSKRLTKNGTRMSKHLEVCKKCPDSVKEKYIMKTTTQVPRRKYIFFLVFACFVAFFFCDV